MFNIILFEPEIPQNCGNIIRLCANSGCILHLIQPFGFTWDDRRLRRAGLDYHEFITVKHYRHFEHFLTTTPFSTITTSAPICAITTKGSTPYDKINFKLHDYFLFGAESKGLPQALLAQFSFNQRINIPMQPNNRSLNLANAVSIIIYEAWRQHHFQGALDHNK